MASEQVSHPQALMGDRQRNQSRLPRKKVSPPAKNSKRRPKSRAARLLALVRSEEQSADEPAGIDPTAMVCDIAA